MYKKNSQNAQGRASRLVYKDVVKSDYKIEPEEEYENLKARYKILGDYITSNPGKASREAEEYTKIKDRLTELKPLIKKNHVRNQKDYDYFIKAARIVLPVHLYNAVWKEAELFRMKERALHGIED